MLHKEELAVLVVAVAIAFSGAAVAQQQPTAKLNETVEVRLIEIDAVVTDRKGNHISGLKASDFELFENGRPQVISNFSEYNDGVDVTATAGQATVTAGNAPPPPRQPRMIAILIDALPLRGQPRKALFADLRALVDKTMREGDRALVLSWQDRQGMGELAPVTLARADIMTALDTAEAKLHAPVDFANQNDAEWFREMASVIERDGMRFDGETHVAATAQQAAQEEFAVMRRKTAAIQRVVSAIAQPTHRNVLIYVSGGFPMVAGSKHFAGLRADVDTSRQSDYNTGSMLDAITRTANAHGVIVYALRPQVPPGPSRIRSAPSAPSMDFEQPEPFVTDMGLEATILQDDAQALNIVAAATGGTVSIGSNAISDAVDRIARDLGSYYTLAYRATADGNDRERRIEVRAKTRGHIVRTRKTILDRSDESRARDLLVARLFEIGGDGQIDFDIEAGTPLPGQGTQVTVPIELTIPVEQLRFEPEGEELAANFSVLLVAGKDIGRISRLIDDAKRVAVPKDKQPTGVVRYQFGLQLGANQTSSVTVAVFDEKSGLAGTASIDISGGQIQGEAVTNAQAADDAWAQGLRLAQQERKPLVVYFRPRRCGDCARFERESLPHPAIQRRLSEVIFATLPATAGQVAKIWKSRGPGLAMFDRMGTFRLSYDGIPDTVTLGIILDDINDVAPHLDRAVTAIETGEPKDGELDSAVALIMLGKRGEARAALERAIAEARPETRQQARVIRAYMDGQENRGDAALKDLDDVIAGALTPHIAGEAWLASGLVRLRKGASAEASLALMRARDLLDGESRVAAVAEEALDALGAAGVETGTIRVIPPDAQVVSGRVNIATRVTSAEVAAVAFTVDGTEVERVQRPPFAATLDLGTIPEQRTIGAVAFDALGIEAGRHEIIVNEGGERFWFRILDPREGAVGGRTLVKMALRSPANDPVQQVVISWNDEERTVVSGPPWETTISIPQGELGILRGVARLADGRSAEDAVLLNASGHTERADVQLVELPVTLSGGKSTLAKDEIYVRENGRRRNAVSIQEPAGAPLTVGLIIDTSGSMQKSLAEAQEAAIGFLDRILGERDRAFIVAFSTRAKLVQTPTSDKALLRKKIMSLRARGSTALYDAIAVGLLQLHGVKGRRALVVLTDGADKTSRYTESDVSAFARRTHVPIHLMATSMDYSSLARPRDPSGALTWGTMFRNLSRMTESTGGSTHEVKSLAALPEVYGTIEEALRSQFLVFVRADAGKNENDWRDIQVEVATRGITVHAPEGYYAPW